MVRKVKIEFDEMNVQESVTYILATEFGLKPNVLKAEIKGDGSGIMILIIEGDPSKADAGVARLEELGFVVKELERHILRDKERCFSCGACISQCPTRSFAFDPVTWEVHLDIDTCIACGSYIDSCSVKALKLNI